MSVESVTSIAAAAEEARRTEHLRELEEVLREQWRLGQNIMLCWCPQDEGIYVMVVPHYYLGQFSASLGDDTPVDKLELLNGRFIRQLISSQRRMSTEDFFSTAHRFEIEPMLILSPVNASSDEKTLAAAEELIKRYSISYVDNRAVLLFDIVDFSLYSPFEQTSQLNSLSYSMNSAHNKLLKKNIKIDFARTTTGDGFYVWNRSLEPRASVDLFQFMLLVIADNAIARRKARGNKKQDSANSIVPLLRTAFHIGSHFEFYQVEGCNPTLHSYIVGDVTIELARMVDIAHPGQIFIGDFKTIIPTSLRETAFPIDVDAPQFVERIAKHLENLHGIELSGERIEALRCQLTGETGVSAGQQVRRFRITDKHGLSRHAFNLRINIHTSGSRRPLILGIQGFYLPKPEMRFGRRATDVVAQAAPRRQSSPSVAPEKK